MNLDRAIFKAIKNIKEDHPQNLVNILGVVDSQQKLILTYEELQDGLQRLIANGQVAEASPGHYFDPAGQPHSSEFSGISTEDYKEACHEYIRILTASRMKMTTTTLQKPQLLFAGN